jgi:hypothetical protein
MKTRQKDELSALLDSGCTCTCIDEEHAKSRKWFLCSMEKPLDVVYANRPGGKESQIWYYMNLCITVAGMIVATSALVTHLGKYKMFPQL